MNEFYIHDRATLTTSTCQNLIATIGFIAATTSQLTHADSFFNEKNFAADNYANPEANFNWEINNDFTGVRIAEKKKKTDENKRNSIRSMILESFPFDDEDLSDILKFNAYKSSLTLHEKQRLAKIYMLALNWKDKKFVSDKDLLSKPIHKEYSIYDLLKNDQIDSELILFLGSRLSNVSRK